jgi:endonuclease/exonuclease/phosphatase family metal-dependent hydrolase
MVVRRTLLLGATAAALGAAPHVARAARPAGTARPLAVLAFNVLAPLWAAPRWYPEAMDPAVLDAAWRRARTIAFLREVAPRLDVVCLQEVEARELRHYADALGAGFVGSFAGHDPHYWSSYLVPELPWVPNGNAVFVRRSAVIAPRFADVALGGTGNHAALVTGTIASNGRPLVAASVHLDSDSNSGRRIELQSLLAQWPLADRSVDLIVGDINEDTVTGSAAGMFKQAGFVDVLATLGNREATHPFSASYNASPRWAIIDHVMARGASPRAGDVFDFGVWSIADEVERIEENFRRCGADHFPLGAQVGV